MSNDNIIGKTLIYQITKQVEYLPLGTVVMGIKYSCYL